MKDNMMWERIGWMKKDVTNDLLLSISFSIFGMLLIFGLGFVFPTIDPYVVIKWIIVICAAVFFYSIVSFLVLKMIRMKVGKVMMNSSIFSKTKKSSRK